MKKKVVHLTHTDIEIDSRILKELESLAETGEYSVTGFGVKTGSKKILNDSLELRLINISLFSRKLSWLPDIARHMITMIEITIRFVFMGAMQKPYVVHCHDSLCLPGAVLIKIICGCKLVYDAHELESDKNSQSVLMGKATLLLERLCWSKIDLLVTVSDSIIEWYSQALGFKDSVLVLNSPQIKMIPDGANQADISSQYFRNLYHIADDKTIFVYVGMLMEGRGLRLCLEVFSSPDIDAHFVCLGDGGLADIIKSYAIDNQNIHYHAPVVHDEVVRIISSADVGICLIEDVSLSDHFCLPNKLFEYVFAHLPVLASRLPEIEKVVEIYSLGKCCALEVRSIQESVQEFSDKKGIRSVSTNISPLTWQSQADNLILGYSRL